MKLIEVYDRLIIQSINRKPSFFSSFPSSSMAETMLDIYSGSGIINNNLETWVDGTSIALIIPLNWRKNIDNCLV